MQTVETPSCDLQIRVIKKQNSSPLPHTPKANNSCQLAKAEPVFVVIFRSPGIDSQPGGPVRKPYLSYWPARLQRLAKSIPRNRFLGSVNVYKYGLWLPYPLSVTVIFLTSFLCSNTIGIQNTLSRILCPVLEFLSYPWGLGTE